jgi:enoyl-CoA hydratase/carnithine racemase
MSVEQLDEQYPSLELSQSGQVFTVAIRSRTRMPSEVGKGSHWDLARLFTRLREDDSVRVVVLTGTDNQFKVPQSSDQYHTRATASQAADPGRQWHTFAPIIRCHQVMAEMEKPIVARVNGDAIGFGQSLVFASDIIIARKDATFLDHHMAGRFRADYGGEIKDGGHAFSSVPGDGGLALVPLFMSPVKAKEYLMLAKPYTADEMAALGVINYAVEPGELDAKVAEIVDALLSRGSYALAWTKRVVNRRVVEHLNMTLDAGIGYEMATFLQLDRLGGEEPHTLG